MNKIISFQLHPKHNKQAKHIRYAYELQAVEQQDIKKYKKPSTGYVEVALHFSNARWMKE